MIRVIIGFIALLTVIAGFAWLADHPGTVEITFEGFIFTSSFIALAGALIALIIVLLIIFWALMMIRFNAPIVGKNGESKKLIKGLDEYTAAKLALKSGNTKKAKSHNERAALYLSDDPLILIQSAEVAEAQEQGTAAIDAYKKMQSNAITRSEGLRGQVRLLRKAGDDQTALKIALIALNEDKKSHWANEQVFGLQAKLGDWAGAEKTLSSASKAGAVDAEITKKYRGALNYTQGIEQALAGDNETSLNSFKSALKNDPSLTPAAVRLAKSYLAEGHTNRAGRALKAAWKAKPHPDLVTMLMKLHPTSTNLELKEKLNDLIKDQKEHPESTLALAQLAAEDAKWGEVNRLLNEFLVLYDSRRAWLLLGDALLALKLDASDALSRAATSGDPLWECGNCGATAASWSPHCGDCGRFGRTNWQDYPRQEAERRQSLPVQITKLDGSEIKAPSPAEG